MYTQKQLMSLINSTQVLTSTRNLDDVLQLLIDEALSVFYWADASVLFLYDENRDCLKAKSAVGFNMEFLRDVQLKGSEGMSGKTFELKEPQLFISSGDTHKGMEDLSADNKELYRKALGTDFRVPTSTITAPLMHHSRCFGVLAIDSFSDNVTFTEENLMILQTFANQAMIAIENATLFSQNNRSNHIHKELTEVYMTQRGLDSITTTLSKLIAKEVGVMNDFYNVLSYTSEKMRKVMHAIGNDFPSEVQTRFQKEVSFSREVYDLYFFPIKINRKTAGLLTILTEKATSLDSLDLFAIEQATTVFALELQSQTQFITSQFNEDSYLVNRILEGSVSGEKVLKKKNMYHRENSYSVITLLIEDEIPIQNQLGNIKSDFSRNLFHQLSHLPYKVLVYENSLRYSLVVISKDSALETEQKVKSWLRQFLLKSKIPFSGGVGRQLDSLDELSVSLNDSYKSIDYLLKFEKGKKKVLSYSELGVYRLLLNVEEEELRSFVSLHLSELLNYDQQNGTELTRTLEVYMDHTASIGKTAKSLFVHENTVKYRMTKIKRLLGLPDLRGDIGLQIQLALKARSYLSDFELSE